MTRILTTGQHSVLKFPKVIIAAILGLVTTILIIGYELQVQKIGKAASESNGQPAYPTYELAPYRLATVLAGLFVAFIWTVFPYVWPHDIPSWFSSLTTFASYPITESSELRRDVGKCLYLLANLHSVVGEGVRARVRNVVSERDSYMTHWQMLKFVCAVRRRESKGTSRFCKFFDGWSQQRMLITMISISRKLVRQVCSSFPSWRVQPARIPRD